MYHLLAPHSSSRGGWGGRWAGRGGGVGGAAAGVCGSAWDHTVYPISKMFSRSSHYSEAQQGKMSISVNYTQWYCQKQDIFCWFCLGQCVWIVRMKIFWTNLQWPETKFCYISVFWLQLVTGWDRLHLMSLNKFERICWSALLLILASITIIMYVTQQASIVWAQ